jgi:hypothetical protein
MSDVESPREETDLPVSKAGRFTEDLIALCKVLEVWRTDQNAIDRNRPDEFPEPNWKQIGYSIIFYAIGAASLLVRSWVSSTHSTTASMIYSVSFITCELTGCALVLRGSGIAKRQFISGIKSLFSKKENYPFTQLIQEIARDATAAQRLSLFTLEQLKHGLERINVEETELRERITTIVGQPSLVVLAGLLASVWATWKSYHSGSGYLEIALVLISIGAFAFAAYGFRLRVSLFDLIRCRALLAFEIAARGKEA